MRRWPHIALCSLAASCSLLHGFDDYSFDAGADATGDRGSDAAPPLDAPAPDAVERVDAGIDAADVRDVPDLMDVRDAPDAPDAPDALDAPDAPDAPDVVDVWDVRDAPDAPDVVDVWDVRDAPDARDVADVSDVRDAPDARDAEPDGGECASGHVWVESARVCEPLPPRPQAPLSTSRVTVARPRLSWLLLGSATGVRLTLCRDRAMTFLCANSDLEGRSGLPDAALSAGVWYWQLQARSAAGLATGRSPVWQLTVGADSGLDDVVNTAWGASLDLNGNGTADMIISAPEANQLFVYASPLAAAAIPVATISDGGDRVTAAGDINGDGFPDVASERSGTVFIFRGSPAGIVSAPLVRLGAPAPNEGFGASIAGAGDVNGDGYADLVVGAPGSSATDVGRVYLFFGGPGGPNRIPSLTLFPPIGGRFGTSVAGAGDVNGDGLGDVIVSAPSLFTMPGVQRGQAYVFLGRTAVGPAATPAVVLEGLPNPTMTLNNGNFGVPVASAGDVNGDGRADVMVAATGQAVPAGNGQVYVYLGTAAGVATTPIVLPGPHGGYFGDPLGAAGDVNGDGFGDVVIAAHEAGAPGGGGAVGRAYVYLGSASGMLLQVSLTDPSPHGEARFGFGATGLGDVNNDGYDDWAVGDPNEVPASVHVYLGSDNISDVPAFAITAPATPDVRGFGYWIARAAGRRGRGPWTAPRLRHRGAR